MGVVKCCQLVKKVLLVILAHKIYFFIKKSPGSSLGMISLRDVGPWNPSKNGNPAGILPD